MSKLKKIVVVISIMLIQSSLVGAGIFAVGLRNVDKGNERLVKIDALVGGQYMPNPTKTPNTEEQQEQPKQEDDNEKETEKDEPEVKPTKKLSITVRVSGTNTYLNGSIVVGAPFETQFSSIYDGSQKVILQDDYADYQTYKEILDFFEENGIKPEERKL